MNKMSPQSQMRLPIQSAPVNRLPGAVALSGGPGMEPSFNFFDDILGPVVKTVGPALPGIIGGLV
jgi:hypothetical protein